MYENIKSEGKCFFCNKTYKQAGINRHLRTHLKKLQEDQQDSNKSFLLKIETSDWYEKTPFFLYLWVNEECSLRLIDDFLRKIWLECCGHMSSFTDKDCKNRPLTFDISSDIIIKSREFPIHKKVKEVCYKGQKIEYTYDFGSSTELLISVEEVYQLKTPENIVLLSRNEPLNILCEECGKNTATVCCSMHHYEDNSMFCPKCAKKHKKECEDFNYASLPIVNSPRSGVCGYDGGIIDTERDLYKENEQSSTFTVSLSPFQYKQTFLEK